MHKGTRLRQATTWERVALAGLLAAGADPPLGEARALAKLGPVVRQALPGPVTASDNGPMRYRLRTLRKKASDEIRRNPSHHRTRIATNANGANVVPSLKSD